MASSTTTTGNGSSAENAKADFDALKNDMKALRADLAALVQDSSKVAQDEARRQMKKAEQAVGKAGERAGEYREEIEDRVRDHPFAAVGIALAAGFVLASLARR